MDFYVDKKLLLRNNDSGTTQQVQSCSFLTYPSGGSKVVLPAPPPTWPKIFAISCSFFLGKCWQNHRLAPPPGGLAPLLQENPGSAPVPYPSY